MKTLLMICFCGAVFFLCLAGYETQATTGPTAPADQQLTAKPATGLPDGVFWLLQPSSYVFAGPQLTAKDFSSLAQDYPIKTVIRLNLEAKSLSVMDTAAERRLLRSYGINLYCFNIEGKAGQLNESVLRQIDTLLQAGGAYVHCLHGQHRAKAVAGRYYAQQGYRKSTIYDLLAWWPVVRDITYQRYVAHVAAQTQINKAK